VLVAGMLFGIDKKDEPAMCGSGINLGVDKDISSFALCRGLIKSDYY
jgi:hypothetical protein